MYLQLRLLLVKQWGHNRLNAEREGTNIEFQVTQNFGTFFHHKPASVDYLLR